MDSTHLKLIESQQEPLENIEDVQAQGWAPKTISDVEWALEEAAASEAELASIDAQFGEWLHRAEARRDMLKSRASCRAEYFKAQVAVFAEAHKDDLLVGKKKSRDFISGRVGWRKKGGKLVVTDKAQLTEWVAEQDPAMYRVAVSPVMAEVQRHFQATGELPPGTQFEAEHDEVYVEAVSMMLPEGK